MNIQNYFLYRWCYEKQKKKISKKKLETREFFFPCTKKIYNERKRVKWKGLHHYFIIIPPNVAQFLIILECILYFPTVQHTQKRKIIHIQKIRPPEKIKKVYYYKTIVFDWVFITRCVKLKVNNTKILERRKNGNFHY